MVPVGVEGGAPWMTRVTGVYPNPFNPTTVINYEIAGSGAKVEIAIHDVRGMRVRTLIGEEQDAGEHRVIWDGSDDDGRRVASGMYVCRMTVDDVVATIKIALVK
jgi:flagellar hook assembly protein FlgD